ncbi:inositol monophosphatase family protein [Pseudomarimonas arenosa]|uniref:Inositol-1-monophosphatase n=1 Tax=Pseudomarimonas arenosa TaxID=2774145 RepID=A0AAW3ZN52_9GAMM|nr:inositol monophosphatase family protein [Pseudomarimonas arenosa]MBD8527398.1 inositol monophosphatase [Pseudomarimonas arenosa]
MQKPAVTVMIKAARQAGNLIVRQIGRVEGLNVVEKAKHDFASEVDAQAEREIIRELKRAFPDHAFLGEESGKQGNSRFTWVIDPLDGTSNFLHGIGHYCVSIALLDRDEPIHGVVYDPLRNEIFHASKGSGAFLNERRIRVTQRTELSGAMLITGFPPRERKRLGAQLKVIEQLLTEAEAEDIRRTGSAALDLAYVAAGRADAYFEAGVKPWDIAAGMLLVREAGGRCCDFRGGGDKLLDAGQLIASNIKLSDPLSRAMVQSGYATAFD